MNREIIYERNLSGSYMKIPAGIEAEFDEKMMLKRKLPGLLSVEKCYVDGAGQYWYNISGVQSLDTYCRFKSIGMEFVEQLIISICREIEILEQNLLDQNTILLDPELIFIANQNQELVFTIYPGNKDTVEMSFQGLMEYLLTKIDHKDMEAVHAAYGIYEKTLTASYSLSDIRDEILYARKPAEPEETAKPAGMEKKREPYTVLHEEWRNADEEEPVKRKKYFSDLNKTYQELQEKFVSFRETLLTFGKKGRMEQQSEKKSVSWPEKKTNDRETRRFGQSAETGVVYPDEEDPEEMLPIHPTVCLRQYGSHPEGLLLYEGKDSFSDIYLEKDVLRIGKDADADIVLERETISRFHAKIHKEKEEYYIEDLNSTNGTYVNDEILSYKEPRRLKTNDQVRFADIKYRFL